MTGLMIQGTASDVGKSLIQTVLCRLLARDGYKVAPFKSQNMTRRLYSLPNGKVISLSQAHQARAAKVDPEEWMNPIVLKPELSSHSSIYLLGEYWDQMSGSSYREHFYEKGLQAIRQSLTRLQEQYEVLVLEGAGSPVEINLKNRELVNMKIAQLADVPVILVADIDRGGVFASLMGTLALLSKKERERVQGIIINKFRGERSLFATGEQWIEENLGLPVLGVIPYLEEQTILDKGIEEGKRGSEQADPYDYLVDCIKGHLDYEQVKKIIAQWKN